MSLKALATDDLDIITRRMEMLANSTNRLDTINAAIAAEYHKLLATNKTELGKLGRATEFAEKVILAITEQHPEWFTKEKSVQTVFGSVNARATTCHECADEAHTIRLIESAAARCEDEVEKARLLGLVRVKKELNIEAVECLDKKDLARLQIVRVKRTSLTIKLAKPTAPKKSKGKKTTPEAPVLADAA
jgi:hypothetical protein